MSARKYGYFSEDPAKRLSSERLIYFRTPTTGTVHVEHLDPPAKRSLSGDEAWIAGPLVYAICGVMQTINERVTTFADVDLCARCVNALGEDSLMAFDPDRPEHGRSGDTDQ